MRTVTNTVAIIDESKDECYEFDAVHFVASVNGSCYNVGEHSCEDLNCRCD